MDLCGHFEYNGVSSRKYGLVFVNAETSRMKTISGSINAQTIFNKTDKKKHLIGVDYSESAVTFDVEIITDTERLLEIPERREIEKWLFNSTRYQKLYLDIADDCLGETYEFIDGVLKRLYLNCRFINAERMEYNGGIVGYKATVECDTGFWMQDALTKSFVVNNASETSSSVIELTIDTDMKDYVYPKIKIQMGNTGGDITIINNTDSSSRLTKFIGLSPYLLLQMNGETNYISGQNYEKFCYQNFVRLLDGTNKITLIGDIESIEFEFQNRRFL